MLKEYIQENLRNVYKPDRFKVILQMAGVFDKIDDEAYGMNHIQLEESEFNDLESKWDPETKIKNYNKSEWYHFIKDPYIDKFLKSRIDDIKEMKQRQAIIKMDVNGKLNTNDYKILSNAGNKAGIKKKEVVYYNSNMPKEETHDGPNPEFVNELLQYIELDN